MSATSRFSKEFRRLGIPKTPTHYYVKKLRPFEERMRVPLEAHKHKRLALVRRQDNKPVQFQMPKVPPSPTIKTIERKLPSMVESALPYAQYSPEAKDRLENYEPYYDPLFNPHLQEERHRVNPDDEPFNAIYADSQAEATTDYTKVRNITSQELWACVERLGKLKIAPMPKLRKANEPVKPLPSGYVPPPETPPDLPYFVARTRNYLLPVYYKLDSDPNECHTIIKCVTGDLWKLEADLRTHLESLQPTKRRILSSVQEPDELISFRGKYLHEVVDWLHTQGF